jgi:hypothetical protein
MGYVFWRIWCYVAILFDGFVIRNDILDHRGGWAIFLAVLVGLLIVVLVISDIEEHL